MLNACWHHGIDHEVAPDHPEHRRSVLNACWHHGIDHLLVSPNGLGASTTVLNACWHHGIDHLRSCAEVRSAIMCSTPAGITESITSSSARSHGACCVLNACWHHGIDHLRGRRPDRHGDSSAQRLLASRNRSHVRHRQNDRAEVLVLNACWHHGIDHAGTYVVGVSLVQLCSTPAGITESITHCYRLLRYDTDACSTPAGITESITGVGRTIRRDQEVLNACWHHGIDHIKRERRVDVEAGRVLNACWHHGIDHLPARTS